MQSAIPRKRYRRANARRYACRTRRPEAVIWNLVHGAELQRVSRLRREYLRRKQVLRSLSQGEIRVPFLAMLQADIRKAGSPALWVRAPLIDAHYALVAARRARDLALRGSL